MFTVLHARGSALYDNNTQTVKLWEAIPGNHRGETVTVSARLMTELHTAQSVIDTVKENLSYGAGNLKNDFMLTSGESYQRSIAARHIRDTDFRGDDNGLAKSALAAQAGTCSEYSALIIAYLSNMDLHRPIFTYAAANEPDHQFNVIGDIRESADAVVVDAWPSFAKAHLLNNATFQPSSTSVLDVHYPGMKIKLELEDMAEVAKLSKERVAQINRIKDTPSYEEVLRHRPDIGLRNKLHGINNLGVRYQNRDDSSDIFENKVSSHNYERQAHGVFLVQHHLSDGAYDINPESLHNAEEDS